MQVVRRSQLQGDSTTAPFPGAIIGYATEIPLGHISVLRRWMVKLKTKLASVVVGFWKSFVIVLD